MTPISCLRFSDFVLTKFKIDTTILEKRNVGFLSVWRIAGFFLLQMFFHVKRIDTGSNGGRN